MGKKILIIGAGVEQVGAIIEAKKMGHFVIVTDMNPLAPGIKHADKFYEVSTTDAKGNIKVGKKEKTNGVMTVCSETAVPTVAKVAKELNLTSFSEETALIATNKSEMRKILTQNNINVSPYIIANNIKDVIQFTNKNIGPWVFKPVDSSGQRGTSIINDKTLINEAFINAQNSSNTKEVLVDRFIQGPEIHITIQVINKKAYYLAISDRITLNKDKFGIAVRHIGPSVLDAKIENKVKDLCNKSINAINLENGILTCEIIINNNTPYLMELAVRVPGGYLREVAMHISGIDIYKTTIWNCLNEHKTYKEMITEEIYNAVSVKFISAINVNNKVKKIEHKPLINIQDFKNITTINFHFDKDFTIPKLNSSVGRFAAIIAVGKTRSEALIATEDVFRSIKFGGFSLIEYNNYNKFNIDFTKELNQKNV